MAVAGSTLWNVNMSDIDPSPHLRAKSTCQNSVYIPGLLLAYVFHENIPVFLTMIRFINVIPFVTPLLHHETERKMKNVKYKCYYLAMNLVSSRYKETYLLVCYIVIVL